MGKIKELADADKEKPETPPSSLDTVKDLVEVIGKIVIGLLAIFYGIGLIVVNIHLNKFSVYSLSLFRLNYITAGMWTLVPIVIVFLIVLLLVSVVSLLSSDARNFISAQFKLTNQASDEPVTDNVFWAILLLVGLALLIFSAYRLRSIDFNNVNFRLTMLSASLVVIYILIWLRVTLKQSHIVSRFARGIILLFFCVLVFVGHLGTFAQGSYTNIPSYLGGGSPKKAQLILDEESKIKEKLADLGVVFKSTTLTANVQILLATEEEYILLIESVDSENQIRLKSLTLPKDMIQAVLYEEASDSGW